MSSWQHYNPVRVIFAGGAIESIAQFVPFQRIALVTSPGFTRRGLTSNIGSQLGKRLVYVLDDVQPNPGLQDIDRQAVALRACAPQCILALGGGSCIDTAKAIARLLCQPATTSLANHFRYGRDWEARAALPIVTIPTTSGTGAEVTPFGTVWDFETGKKHSVTGEDLYSRVAILDPQLTLELPEEVTISSGLDAISHALESVWNINATPASLALASQSLRLSLSALPRLKAQPEDLQTRSKMMQASLLAGLAISQTRTALAHSMSYPITTTFKLPHGIACSFTLPSVMRFNAATDSNLDVFARLVGYRNADAFADGLEDLLQQLCISKIFCRYVPDGKMVAALSGDMFSPSRANNNTRHIYDGDIGQILQDSLRRVSGR